MASLRHFIAAMLRIAFQNRGFAFSLYGKYILQP
jgi:hypothetical protein